VPLDRRDIVIALHSPRVAEHRWSPPLGLQAWLLGSEWVAFGILKRSKGQSRLRGNERILSAGRTMVLGAIALGILMVLMFLKIRSTRFTRVITKAFNVFDPSGTVGWLKDFITRTWSASQLALCHLVIG